MKLDKTATQDDKNSTQTATLAQPPSHAVDTSGSGAEQRRAERQPIIGFNRLAPRTRLVLDADGKDVHPCRIVDVSERGYRISLVHERTIPVGAEIMLEHTDGWRRPVRVRWAFKNEFGLEIIGTNTRVILGPAEEDMLECEILALTDIGYRISLETERKIAGTFLLELANGSRRRVMVRWTYKNELAVQLVENAPRPSPNSAKTAPGPFGKPTR